MIVGVIVAVLITFYTNAFGQGPLSIRTEASIEEHAPKAAANFLSGKDDEGSDPRRLNLLQFFIHTTGHSVEATLQFGR